MSGPKYYSIPVGSPEETRLIYSKLSRISGVEFRVNGGKIDYVVSQEAWMNGVDYTSLLRSVDEVKADIRMKELFERAKTDAIEKTGEIPRKLSSEYSAQKARIDDAIADAEKALKSLPSDAKTEFGTFHFESGKKELESKIKELNDALAVLEKDYKAQLGRCEEYKTKLSRAGSTSEISEIQAKYSRISLKDRHLDTDAGSCMDTVNVMAENFRHFVNTVRGLEKEFEAPEMKEYLSRMTETVGGLDPCAPGSLDRIKEKLKSLREDIAIKNVDRIDEKIKEESKTLVKSIDALLETVAKMESGEFIRSKLSVEVKDQIKEKEEACKEIIEKIGKLEYISPEHKRTLVSAEKDTEEYSAILKSSSVKTLTDILGELQELDEKCTADAENYKTYTKLFDEYREMYQNLYALRSGSKDSKAGIEILDKVFIKPEEYMFMPENAEEQIKILEDSNARLKAVFAAERNIALRSGLCMAIAKTEKCEHISSTKDITAEGTEDRFAVKYDGSCGKGIMLQVKTSETGGTVVTPVGVKLPDGTPVTDTKDLREYHKSCTWGDDISKSLGEVGLNFEYEEGSEEEKVLTYSEENYIQLETWDQAARFLRATGFSDEEIEEYTGRGAEEFEEGTLDLDRVHYADR